MIQLMLGLALAYSVMHLTKAHNNNTRATALV